MAAAAAVETSERLVAETDVSWTQKDALQAFAVRMLVELVAIVVVGTVVERRWCFVVVLAAVYWQCLRRTCQMRFEQGPRAA